MKTSLIKRYAELKGYRTGETYENGKRVDYIMKNGRVLYLANRITFFTNGRYYEIYTEIPDNMFTAEEALRIVDSLDFNSPISEVHLNYDSDKREFYTNSFRAEELPF